LAGVGDALKIKVAAPPEGGRANRAVEALIARQLGLPKKAARIVSGSASARKIVAIEGLSVAEIKRRLPAAES
jgi:uncharacterized protein YggU (UPF0235/DUF167 family)